MIIRNYFFFILYREKVVFLCFDFLNKDFLFIFNNLRIKFIYIFIKKYIIALNILVIEILSLVMNNVK